MVGRGSYLNHSLRFYDNGKWVQSKSQTNGIKSWKWETSDLFLIFFVSEKPLDRTICLSLPTKLIPLSKFSEDLSNWMCTLIVVWIISIWYLEIFVYFARMTRLCNTEPKQSSFAIISFSAQNRLSKSDIKLIQHFRHDANIYPTRACQDRVRQNLYWETKFDILKWK